MLGLLLSPLPWLWKFSTLGWLVLGLLLFVISWWKQWRWLLAIALLAGVMIGLARGVPDMGALQAFSQRYNGREVTLHGVVSEDADISARGETVLRLDSIEIGDKREPVQLWATVPQQDAIHRSDIVTVRGKVSDGFGAFAGSIYRAEVVKIERPTPGDAALAVRDWFGGIVRQHISEPAASLGMGFLMGQRRSLPMELNEALKLAGLTHIIVASGYNLTVLVRMMKKLFSKRSRYLTVFLSGLLIFGFIAVTGLSPSMSRAGLVAGLVLVAWYFGRKFHPVTLLLFAAAVTGLVQPTNVWGNLGWQLSFAAFAGVMLLAPLLQAYFFGAKKPGQIRQILGETISAQIATAPILLLAFGQISNVAVLANLLVLPLVPLAMLGTFITGVLGAVAGPIAALAGVPTQLLLDYMVRVATETAGVEWAQTTFALPLWGVGLMYAGLVAVMLYLKRATRLNLRAASIID